jgi:molybdenum cofactor biosynthesis enzyme MoaA
MSETKWWNAEKIYINEIIRVTYKCNWKCKFCNVLKTNNFWEYDVWDKEVIYQVLKLVRKYTLQQRNNLILSFSWWEPTLNKNLLNYIKLAKSIWIGVVEIQTNWTKLFKDKKYIKKLIAAWLDEIFLAQHSWDNDINKKLWSFYDIDIFKDWVSFILKENINKKISIYLNIVVTSINIFNLYDYITFLISIWFIEIIPHREHDNWLISHKISFWFVQPNWYAEINKKEVLLEYTDEEIKEIDRVVILCRKNNILPDFHFVCPPLCILNYPEYNLEYERLKKLEKNKKNCEINESNLEAYKFLWKEKRKFQECVNCKYTKYCLWFYNNWIDFVWEKYISEKINSFIYKSKI